MEDKLYLGVSREDITPLVGGKLYGYNDTTFSESVHDNLTATAFVLQSGDVRVVLISATVCLIKTELSDRIRTEIAMRLTVPVENCILCATHTHSGPNTAAEPGWGETDEEYCENIFVPRIIKAACDAARKMVYVKIGIARGKSFVGINRRQLLTDNTVILGQNEWGPFDPYMTILSFQDEGKNAIANIVHYGAHGTAAGLGTEITRDWPGVMTDRLEALTGGVTAFFNGPEGDVGPRLMNGGTMGDIRCVEELGSVAAMDAMRIYKKIRIWQDAKIICHGGILAVPLKRRMNLEAVRESLAEFEGGFIDINGAGARKKHLERVLASYEKGYTEKSHYEIPQTIIRIGEVALAGFPYELFSEIGMRINSASKIPHTLSLANANGSEGYFVTEDQICRGGYEVDMYNAVGVQPYAQNA
ncbi:MAG: neutral/alkaline non-lysosomal ceramidase N-terminal domain-containing protein, partial [Roseburia sp.]|nr:neutral/alkaline non-lysosomal ceramidase N-terminal domain-containing protein [Roseburia sp.]